MNPPLRLVAWISLWLALGSSIAAQEPPPETTAQESFQIVVHGANPTADLPAKQIAKMFLKKIKRWDHGVRVRPIDLEDGSRIREDFTQSVHGKSITAIKSFWQRMIFSGRDVPPEERNTDQEILDFVRATPGAIGYISVETPLGDGVKKLDVSS